MADVQAPEGRREPLMIDHYRVDRLLARGTMGDVYLAWEPGLSRRVALKFLGRDFCRNPGNVERFRREARSAADLHHPNVVAVHYQGTFRGRPYFAMEYVSGFSLAEIVAEGPLDDTRAVDWMLQAARGLAAAWEKRLVHRDVKPANMVITPEGVLKMADFGLAKAVGQDSDLTSTDIVVGTPDFISPEQAQGAPVDCRSDMYSLGASFYFALTGEPPFRAPSRASVLVKHITEPLVPVRTRRPAVAPDVAEVVERLMAKNPSSRFSSYEALLAHLSALRERLGAGATGALPPARSGAIPIVVPDETSPPPPLPEPVVPSAPSRAAYGLAGVLGLACLVGLGLTLRPGPTSMPSPSPPTVAPVSPTPSPPPTPAPPPTPEPSPTPATPAPLPTPEPSPTPPTPAPPPTPEPIPTPTPATPAPPPTPEPSPTPARPTPAPPTPAPPPTPEPSPTPTPSRVAAPPGPAAGAPFFDALGMELVWIPPGTFTMGSPDGEPGRQLAEEPRHVVTFTDGFWLGAEEVCQAHYQDVTGQNPSSFPGPARPVETVSWDDARRFCSMLTARERRAFRLPGDLVYELPTEAQWEYACRAGRDLTFGAAATLSSTAANFDGTRPWPGAAPGPSRRRTMPCRTFLPNPWGLHDMVGNVWEWCLDGWRDDYREASPLGRPTAAAGPDRVIRGGSWSTAAESCRAAARGRALAGDRSPSYGFRVVVCRPWPDD